MGFPPSTAKTPRPGTISVFPTQSVFTVDHANTTCAEAGLDAGASDAAAGGESAKGSMDVDVLVAEDAGSE